MTWQEMIFEKIKNIKWLKKERGSIFVLTALLLPIMFGCLGIAYDVGTLYMHKARLQNMTDAAALAGGRAYLQSQTDTYDSYTNGNATDEEYVPGYPKKDSKNYGGKHPAADKAADEYIDKNIINLGNKVYSDKFSHYALPGHKKIGEDYVNADEIFYRIGLYEKVPLYFLPVITNKNVEIVRAGSVVVVKPGTPDIPAVPGGTPTISHTTSAPSIFDNLFTYTDSFNPGLVVENGTIKKKFTGNIVYTYGNGTGEVSGTDEFYNNDATNGEDKFRHTYINKNSDESGLYDVSNINDPIINTYYHTTDYLDVFKNKLLSNHVDIQSNVCTITGDGSVLTKVNTCIYQYNGNYYIRTGNTFYRVTDSSANAFSTITDNGETYKICYHLYPKDNQQRFVLCGKKDGDNRYYLLNSSGQLIPEYYMDSSEVAHVGEWSYSVEETNTSNITIDQINSQYQTIVYESSLTNNGQNQVTVNSQQGNIFHYDAKLTTSTSNGFTLTVDSTLGSSDTPIYVIVDENADNLDIKANGSAQSRPVILVYFGSGRINFENQGESSYFNGTIYAPKAYFWANFSGTFTGNVIANRIHFQTNSVGTWIQHNYLRGTPEIDDVTTTTDRMANSANALTPPMGNTTDTIESLKSALEDKICEKLGVTKEQLNNKNWYNEQPYSKKMELYGKWETLYNSYSENDPLRDMLWPWDIRVTTTVTSSEGSGGTPPIPGTPEVLRLINYRTEYQTKENIQDDDVLDPYIFETLGQPNTY